MDEPPRWVLDTNVVISGLLSAHGPPGRLLDMVLMRQLLLVIDDRIAAEYREVIARPRFAISSNRAAAFLAALQFQRPVSATPWSDDDLPDPDDAMFLEVAIHATDCVLVTGNARHYPRRCRGPVNVLTPREAWTRFTAGD